MKEVLAPLARVPGVRLAALIMSDGVPVISPGRAARPGHKSAEATLDLDAAAALCAGWMEELARAAGTLSWEAPQWAVLRAARGSVLLRRCGPVLLLVVLEAGLSPEDLRLPVESVAARVQRSLRDLGCERVRPPIPAGPAGRAPAEHAPLGTTAYHESINPPKLDLPAHRAAGS